MSALDCPVPLDDPVVVEGDVDDVVASKLKRRRCSSGSELTSDLVVEKPASVSAPLSLLPTADVLAHLQQSLHDLAKLPQGGQEKFAALANEAAHPDVLGHVDPFVRLLSARCVVEGLRIFAPEPPFDSAQLRAIMDVLLDQVSLLAKIEVGPVHEERIALLEKIHDIRAFMLIFEFADSDSLLDQLIRTSLVVARGDPHGHICTILGHVVANVLGEASSVPQLAAAALVHELTPKHRGSQARALVSHVLGVLAQRSATLPINDFLVASLSTKLKKGNRGEVTEQLGDLYEAVLELYKIDPSLVSRVLPSLEGDLQSSDAARRRSVTSVVGRLLAVRNSSRAMPLVAVHPALLDRFLERLEDGDDKVRLAALEVAAEILHTAAQILEEEGQASRRDQVDAGGQGINPTTIVGAAICLRRRFEQRCLDPNETLRLRTIEIAFDVGKSVGGRCLLTNALPSVLGRILDKKARVREAAAEKAAQLYALHALPAWVEGHQKDAMSLAWIPRLLCEAYSLFTEQRLGFTAQLEELIERDVLGCGAGLTASQRAAVFLGFYTSVIDHKPSHKGLVQLLTRKRDAGVALYGFAKLRVENGSPILLSLQEADIFLPANKTQHQKIGAIQSVDSFVESLVRSSPFSEDKSSGQAMAREQLQGLDMVKDKELWAQLIELSTPLPTQRTEDMVSALSKLDRLLRVHKLTEMSSMLRRAIHTTWLLPDQVAALLGNWNGESASAVRKFISEIPRFFPGAFLPHAFAISTHLRDESVEDACAALFTLSLLGKHLQLVTGIVNVASVEAMAPFADENTLASALLCALKRVTRGTPANQAGNIMGPGSVCRKALRSVGLLQRELTRPFINYLIDAADKLYTEADLDSSGDGGTVLRSTGLHLGAACLEVVRDVSGLLEASTQASLEEKWLCRALDAFESTGVAEHDSKCCAAAEVWMAIGSEDGALSLMKAASELSRRVVAHALVCVLRALRHGSVPLTNEVLSRLISQTTLLLAPMSFEALPAPEPDGGALVPPPTGASIKDLQAKGMAVTTNHLDYLLIALQRTQKPRSGPSSVAAMPFADRLRLGVTLPTVLARAQNKLQREAAFRLLKSVLLRASRQCAVRQEPLIEYAVACFLHMLSRCEVFLTEAAASVSAFPESTRMAAFFADALLRCDPNLPMDEAIEFGAAVLKVCERARYFVDRDDPTSEAIHKAAFVLRYVVERRCPELGARTEERTLAAQQVGAAGLVESRGAMPAKLFALRAGAAASGVQSLATIEATARALDMGNLCRRLPISASSWSTPSTISRPQHVATVTPSP